MLSQNMSYDDLTKANADAEPNLDKALARQTQQRPVTVSTELVMALDKEVDALELLAVSVPKRSLRIKHSTFDQMVDQDSSAWATPRHPRAGNDWVD